MTPGFYRQAALHSVGTPPDELDRVGLSVDAGGQPRDDRFWMTLEEAERVAQALLDGVRLQRERATTCQSSIWSGSPSKDVSPQEGQ